MQASDDFFAFNDDMAVISPPKKKKKKKVKKVKSEVSPSNLPSPLVTGVSKLNSSENSFSATLSTTSCPSVNINKKTSQKQTEDDQQEATLTNILGLSTFAESEQEKNKQIHDEINSSKFLRSNNQTNSSFEFYDSMLDRENRRRTTHIVNSSDDDSDDDVIKDDFLTSINSYVSELKAKENEIQNLLESYQRDEVTIKGVVYQAKSVKFELHIDIQAAGQVSGSYDLQVKASTKIGKIINKLMPLFNEGANPQCTQEEWGSLVMYIQKLNIILNPSLKCMSLLGYKNLLDISKHGADFEVFALITNEAYAEMLHSQENIKRQQKSTPDLENQLANDDIFIKIIIEDPQKEKINEVIDVDKTSLQEESEEPKRIFSLTLSVSQGIPISELLQLYKYKASLPIDLRTNIQQNGINLDVTKTLVELQIKNDQVFQISYSIDELLELQTMMENNDFNANDDDDDDDDDDEDENDAKDFSEKNEQESATIESENAGPGFIIFVVGKDKKRYKVHVRPNTKILDISNFYKEKAGLAPDTKIDLLFDDEKLDMNGIVADTELEEDFMIDVVIN
ncbi:hypothetical protein C6P40_001840 [Pichia californica]|uniref:Rad60/SUMO-like domain-containing protein n=1 Tax=Pichia californica TaxID=460514 RepID=A0A9P7BD95_9ASCO|nr:hypothetical protein C6P42_001827 [[Candida] californica]KAG0687812.1 hypothetical protein C6P40_001840 [[Candida] californica]